MTKLLDIKKMQHMDALSRYNPTPLTMQQLVEFGRTATEQDSFHFLKKEVPVRLANIMKEINLLPSSLLAMPSVIELQVTSPILTFCAFLVPLNLGLSFSNGMRRALSSCALSRACRATATT